MQTKSLLPATWQIPTTLRDRVGDEPGRQRILQDGEQAESSFQMAKAAHRLNMMVAFFFPIATLSAIFGTNLRHGFSEFYESTRPLPLLTMVAVGLVLGIVLTAFVNWRMRPGRGDEDGESQK